MSEGLTCLDRSASTDAGLPPDALRPRHSAARRSPLAPPKHDRASVAVNLARDAPFAPRTRMVRPILLAVPLSVLAGGALVALWTSPTEADLAGAATRGAGTTILSATSHPPGEPGLAAVGKRNAPPAPFPTGEHRGRSGPGALVVTVRTRDEPEAPIPDADVGVILEEAWSSSRTEPDAWVRVSTDATGTARLALAPGTYAVIATAEGRRPRSEPRVVVEAGRETPLVFSLPEGTGVSGRVVDDDGRPVAGSVVRYTTRESGEIGIGPARHRSDGLLLTGDDGRFRVLGMPGDGSLLLRADAPGFHHAMSCVDGRDIPREGVLLRLKPGGRIAGTVRDRDGAPVTGARIYAFPPDDPHADWRVPPDSEFTATANANGTYAIDGIALDAPYSVRARAPGHAWSADVEDVVATAARAEARADPVVRRVATVFVRALDPTGRPARETEVELGGAGSALDGSGACRFEGLPPGTFRVTATSPLYRKESRGVVVSEGETCEVRLVLDPAMSIEGLVVDADGRPLGDAAVEIEPTKGGPDVDRSTYAFRADAAGRFRIGGLDAGDYELSADKGPLRSARARLRVPSTDVRLVCLPPASVTFRLLVPGGDPYTEGFNVLVETVRETHNHYVSLFAPDGAATIDGLDAGPVRLLIHPDGWPPLETRGLLTVGASLPLGDLTLDEGVSIAGVVRDLAGRPVAGATVDAGPEATTGDDGRFVLRHLSPGEAVIGVQAEGFLSAARRVHVVEGAPSIDVVLARGGLLRGVLRDTRGDPVTGAGIAFRWAGSGPEPGEPGRARSGSDGRFCVRLDAGRWRSTHRAPLLDDVPLGEWTLAEGETLDVELTLPSR